MWQFLAETWWIVSKEGVGIEKEQFAANTPSAAQSVYYNRNFTRESPFKASWEQVKQGAVVHLWLPILDITSSGQGSLMT